MSVWFAYRCHYDLPATRFVKRFDEATILEWFRNHCKPIADNKEATAYAMTLLGIVPYGFPYFLTRLAEEKVPPPRNNRELHAAFNYWGVQGEWLCQAHAIQGLDDDDEEEMAFYIFDDVFASKYPERVAWLLQEDWRLPADVGTGSFTPAFRTTRVKPRGGGEGTTYLAFLVCHDSCNLSDLNAEADRLDGVRLPELARLLARVGEAQREDYGWCGELHDLADEILAEDSAGEPLEKVFLHELRANPHDDARWNVYGDWLEERGRPRAELWLLQRALERIGKRPIHRHPKDSVPEDTPNRSQWRVEPHLAQLCLHEATVYRHNCFHHWVLFDDLWASAHPDLANSLVRQLERWDVLSSPRRARSD
jgi:uncharacterized protein (TIGR02996 family)